MASTESLDQTKALVVSIHDRLLGQDANAVVESKVRSTALQPISDVLPLTVREKPKQAVLEEDDYVQALDTIIQRDFYPDLPKLRTQLDWLEAEANNDIAKMREIQMKLRRKTLQSVRGTPSSFESATPVSFSAPATPAAGGSVASTPRRDGSLGVPLASRAAPTEEPSGPTAKTNMRLDAFQATHTSEDNSAFLAIMEQSNADKKRKYERLLTEEKKLQEKHAPKLLEDAEGGSAVKQIDTWHNYVSRNELMYFVDGVEYTVKEEMKYNEGPPKEVVLSNTRFDAGDRSKPAAGGRAMVQQIYPMIGQQDERSLAAFRRENQGKIDLDDLRGTKTPGRLDASPMVNGFSFVTTPSPAPGLDASPFMTWGNIDGTPLALPEATSSRGSGPQFQMPETPRREQIGLQLAERVSFKQEKKKQQQAKQRSKALLQQSTSPFTSSFTPTPQRFNKLSPAAKHFVASVARKSGAFGSTPSPSGFKKPEPMTPSHVKRAGGDAVAGSPRVAAVKPREPSRGGAAGDRAQTSGSVTDNLLHL